MGWMSREEELSSVTEEGKDCISGICNDFRMRDGLFGNRAPSRP